MRHRRGKSNMPTQPTITVITPNLNAGRFIEACICSVLDQGYPHAEHFVVDGGSDDSSVAVIRRYEDELAGWRSGPDDGPAAAINWALEKATGQFVIILPSDSVMMPGTLDAIAHMHAKAPNADWLVGHARHIDEFDETISYTSPRPEGGLATWLMHNAQPIAPGSTAYRRSLFSQHGWLDASLMHAWDYEFHARLLSRGVGPMVLRHEMASVRETGEKRTMNETINRGIEQIAAAERYTDALTPEQRPVLWRNLDERRQIFAIAEAEACGASAQKMLWGRLMDRPWWIHSDRFRRAMRGSGLGLPMPASGAAAETGHGDEGTQRRAA